MCAFEKVKKNWFLTTVSTLEQRGSQRNTESSLPVAPARCLSQTYHFVGLEQWFGHRLWGIMSTVIGDNNLIMTGSLILRTAALQFHTSLLAMISQLWWQTHTVTARFSCHQLFTSVFVVTCIHLQRVTQGLCFFAALYNHKFLLLDSETKG